MVPHLQSGSSIWLGPELTNEKELPTHHYVFPITDVVIIVDAQDTRDRSQKMGCRKHLLIVITVDSRSTVIVRIEIKVKDICRCAVLLHGDNSSGGSTEPSTVVRHTVV